MKKMFLLLALIFTTMPVLAQYPSSWWERVDRNSAQNWEILPQDAKAGEVILSKRTQLGVFSNFAHTPFKFRGKRYASIEGLWQGLKFPDPKIEQDMRHQISFPSTREKVFLMWGFEAKEVGSLASKILKQHNLQQVSFEGYQFDYRDFAVGSEYHYQLIFEATLEKIKQNPKLKTLLLQTRGLALRPDHVVQGPTPAAYHYYDILMKIRDESL